MLAKGGNPVHRTSRRGHAPAAGSTRVMRSSKVDMAVGVSCVVSDTAASRKTFHPSRLGGDGTRQASVAPSARVRPIGQSGTHTLRALLGQQIKQTLIMLRLERTQKHQRREIVSHSAAGPGAMHEDESRHQDREDGNRHGAELSVAVAPSSVRLGVGPRHDRTIPGTGHRSDI
jgi:hypothetical protein